MNTKDWFDNSYTQEGLNAQRLYPNEELLRFMGRNYFKLSPEQRAVTKILEVGCGSGSNLWMIAREGFKTFGIDYSPKAIELCQAMLSLWSVRAEIEVGDMSKIPYFDISFDAVIDVFSSYCLSAEEFQRFLGEVKRVLKSGGRFFYYGPCELIGEPYGKEDYAWRVDSYADIRRKLIKAGFKIKYSESVKKTYKCGKCFCRWAVIEAVK